MMFNTWGQEILYSAIFLHYAPAVLSVEQEIGA
jgi:hypothetical protein